MTNTILIPVYDRAEMLYLTLESLVAARNYFELEDYNTIFALDGSPPDVIKVAESYPFRKEIIYRPQNMRLTYNILEAMKVAMSKSDEYVLLIEDAVLIDKTYFKFVKSLLDLDLSKVSVCTGVGESNTKDPHSVCKTCFYVDMSPVITKHFYTKFVLPHSCPSYYDHRSSYVLELDNKYKSHGNSYKFYKNIGKYNEQAGLINRLLDIAFIEDGVYALKSGVHRARDIGFYGANRKIASGIVGTTLEERVESLRPKIATPETIQIASKSTRYPYFSIYPDLEKYEGNLVIDNPQWVPCY